MLIGLNAILYRGVAGATAATEVENIKDLALNLEMDEGDTTTRGSGGLKQSDPTLLAASIEFDMLVDNEDADYLAIRTAFLNRAAIAAKVVNKENGAGLDADFKVFKFNETQNLGEAQKVSVSMKPCRSARKPVFVEPAAAGAGA